MRFPVIRKVCVDHLSIYRNSIEFSFLPGINVIIGGNGIGKTTLVNTILYGLVGLATYESFNPRTGKTEKASLVSPDFFLGRISPTDYETAIVSLTFEVSSNVVTISRFLYRPIIKSIKVEELNNRTTRIFENCNNLEQEYQKLMVELLDVGEFENFVFIVANLLVFGENRQTLVWNNEVQNRIIRLLFLEREFDIKFDKLGNQVTRYDTDARHKSETRKDINRAIERWVNDKSEMNRPGMNLKELDGAKLEIRYAELQTALDRINEEINNQEVSIDREMGQLKILTTEVDQLEIKKMNLSSKLDDLEGKFYSKTYQKISPEFVIILETLIRSGKCEVCGSSGEALQKLGQSKKEKGECIVCGSKIDYGETTSATIDDEELTAEINRLRKTIDEMGTEQQSRINAQVVSSNEINQLQGRFSYLIHEKRQMETEVAEIRSILLNNQKEQSASAEDPWLEKQRKEIAILDQQISDLYQKRNHSQLVLNQMNEKLLDVIYRVNEELTPIFSDFASRFLGTNCELVVSQKTKARKPIAYVFPRFHNKDREDISYVSESQRFFLDQAFRMALITWYVRQTGESTFYIVETPEGSLDLAYENNVADMYVQFATYKHSIIITSNLNSSNFLVGLYSSLNNEEEKRERTLDLLRYGKLSSVQEKSKYKEQFKARIRQLGLPLIWAENQDPLLDEQ